MEYPFFLEVLNMKDINIIQQKDLDGNFFTIENKKVQIKLSQNDNNQLTMQPDGLYYGQIAPPDVRNQFVDAINGDDNNPGSLQKPLKTITKAIQRVPARTTLNTICLKEEQTHEFNSMVSVYSDIIFYPYGPNLDRVEAIWNSPTTGWTCAAAKEYVDYRPTIKFNRHFTAPSLGGYTPASIDLNNARLKFFGMNIISPDVTGAVNQNNWWNAAIFGTGDIMLVECKIDNSNSGDLKWHLISTHDGSISFRVFQSDVVSSKPENYIFSSMMPLTVQFSDRTEFTHSSGLIWRGATPKEIWSKLVSGALEPRLMSPNYITIV